MTKTVYLFSLFLTTSFSFGQDAPTTTEKALPTSKLKAAIDVVYPYLWRGLKYNADRVAFQPSVNYNLTDKLSFGLWATTNFS